MTGEATATQLTADVNPVSFLTGEFRKAAEAIPPEVLAMTEHDLFKSHKCAKNDFFLRKNLWKAVDRASKAGETEITAAEVYQGVISSQTFHNNVLSNPFRVAMILIRPTDDRDQMEEALHFGMDRLRNELLTMPITKETAGHFLKALEFLANRHWGPMIQRIEAKHAHLNLNKPMADLPRGDALARLDEVKQKLLEKDVTPVGDEGGS